MLDSIEDITILLALADLHSNPQTSVAGLYELRSAIQHVSGQSCSFVHMYNLDNPWGAALHYNAAIDN